MKTGRLRQGDSEINVEWRVIKYGKWVKRVLWSEIQVVA